MKEDLLQYLWRYQKFMVSELCTTNGETLHIESPGILNTLEGPDFFDARLRINGQLWAGNVEVHVKASDWYAHGHELDENYQSVILHVVWEDDISVYVKGNRILPTFVLGNHVSQDTLEAYANLMAGSKLGFINCNASFEPLSSIAIDQWLTSLYVERMEGRSVTILKLLKESNNDWEKVLFQLLAKAFGLNRNGDAFLSMATAIDFKHVRKLRSDAHDLESLFHGVSGLLANTANIDGYYHTQQERYTYIKHKFQLQESLLKPRFFGLRPNNFPTIRLSQLAALYHTHQQLFQKLVAARTLEAFYEIFKVVACTYWNEHYTYGKAGTNSPKRLTKSFINLLVLNCILPVKYAYEKEMLSADPSYIIDLAYTIPAEKNSVIDGFTERGQKIDSAFKSQSFLQLYKEYCTRNKCMHCAVGHAVLNRKEYF